MRFTCKPVLIYILPAFLFLAQCTDKTATSNTGDTEEDTTIQRVGANAADAYVQSVVRNALVFHIDDSMQTGVGYKASLALGKNQVLEDLKKQMQESTGATEKELQVDTTLKVAATMRARLKDLSPSTNRSFDITAMADNTEIQELNDETDNKAFWQWNVVPLKDGKHKLELVVEIVLDKRRTVFLPSKTIGVTIYTKSDSFGSKFSAFVDKNWQWLITAILIPIFVAWITTRIRQRQQSTPSTTVKKKKRKL